MDKGRSRAQKGGEEFLLIHLYFPGGFQGAPLERSITRKCGRFDGRGRVRDRDGRALPSMRRPQHFPTCCRPVSGLASLDPPPSHDRSQWLVGGPALAYRCGGSTGVAPVSRLTGRFRPAPEAGRIIAEPGASIRVPNDFQKFRLAFDESRFSAYIAAPCKPNSTSWKTASRNWCN